MFSETISSGHSGLLEIISKAKDINDNFYLAGGTALALQLGHRKSFDLDFFSHDDFNVDDMAFNLSKNLGATINSTGDNTLYATIDNIKTFFISFKYKILKDFVKFSNVKLASFEDIACMKCSAISQRAEKKDFYDLYEILKRLQPIELRNLLTEKFDSNGFNPYYMALTFFYFDEVEKSPEPISLNGTTWKIVKNYLIKNQSKILKAFI